MRLPRYPVYVPSKGRATHPYTIRMLEESDVPYAVVLEREEIESYRPVVRSGRLLELPESGQGSSVYARNWILEHAKQTGLARHWQLDDNIGHIARNFRAERIRCAAGPALAVVEDFVDRFENVTIAGLNYRGFGHAQKPPYIRNVHVYSATLIDNAMPFRWRGRYNEDTDLCLQVLAAGLCTVLINAFVIDKKVTMTLRGGNTDDLYRGDGRLVMARSLERVWPGVVRVARRYGRPQHVVDWTRFDTPLKLRADVDLSQLEETDEYGLQLVELKTPKSERMRSLSRARRIDSPGREARG